MPPLEPCFDLLNVADEVEHNKGWHRHLGDSANCPILVQDLVELLSTISADLRSYSSCHGLDQDFRHVCMSRPCCSDHVGCTHVSHSEASSNVRPLGANMHLVVNRYIKPWTAPCRVSYAGALLTHHHLIKEKGAAESSVAFVQRIGTLPASLAGNKREKRRAATHAAVFVSHNWAERFEDFVATAQSVASPDTYIWVCAFALNQNASIGDALTCDTLEQCAFARALKYANHVVVFMDAKAETLERVWCILEAHFALLANCAYSIAVPDSSDIVIWEAVRTKCAALDVRNAQASVAADRERIMAFIRGREDHINLAVRELAFRSCDDAFALRAAKLGDAAALEEVQRPHCADAGQSTTLHHAASAPTPEAVIALLRLQADPGVRNARGETALHGAAASLTGKTVSPLVSAGAGVQVRDTLGRTPLHIAATSGSPEAVRWLLEGAAEVEAVSLVGGISPLHMAAKGGHISVARLLMEARAMCDRHSRESEPDPTRMRLIGGTALHAAARAGHEAVVSELVKYRSDMEVGIRAGAGRGATPFMSGAVAGHVAIVQLLTKMQANPNVQLNSGMMRGARTLHYAALWGLPEVIQAVLEAHAEIDAVATSFMFRGIHAVHTGAFGGHAQAVQALLAARASHSVAYTSILFRGGQPLHGAAYKGDVHVVQVLVAARADPNHRCTSVLIRGTEPIHTAATSPNLETEDAVRELLASRAELDGVVSGLFQGSSCLHIAAARGKAGLVDVLLEAKCIVDRRTYLSGATPVHLALKANGDAVLRCFAKHGVDLDMPSSRGLTPLAWAYLRMDRTKVHLLRNLGASRLFGPLFCCRRRRQGANSHACDINSVAGADICAPDTGIISL